MPAQRETPRILRTPKHGKGKLSVGNPGNKGGGRLKRYAEERAAQLAADPETWDAQLSKAREGNLDPLKFATERAFGKVSDQVEHTGEVTIKVEFDDD